MARNANFDTGQAALLPSLKIATALDIVHNRAEHELGFCQVDEYGNEHIYVRFGEAGTQYDAFMFDETFGGNRSDSNGYSGTAENGARLLDIESHGSLVSQVGILMYPSAVTSGQYGFLQVKGWAIAKLVTDNNEAPTFTGSTAIGTDEDPGALTLGTTGGSIIGITAGNLAAITGNGTNSEIKVFLQHPTLTLTATTAVASQPNLGRADDGWARLPQQDY